MGLKYYIIVKRFKWGFIFSTTRNDTDRRRQMGTRKRKGQIQLTNEAELPHSMSIQNQTIVFVLFD